MEEWKEVKLGEVGRIITGKTPKTSIVENYNGNIPFLTPSDNMSYKYSPETNKTITELGLLEVKNCLLPANSICVSCIGSDLGKVVITKNKLVTNQQINSIVLYDGFDPDFIYYVMTIEGKKLNALSKTSTAVPIINKSTFSNHIVKLPPLPTQKKIADILSSLDDKIEVNRRINENLEAQAQALFKSWFVDFEPFKDGEFVESELGMIPKGWRVGTLGNYCKVKSGFAFKSSWWQEDGNKVIKIKNITSDGNLDMNDCSYVATENTIKAKDFQTKVGDLLIAMTGATIGKFCIVSSEEIMFVNQRVGKFFLGDNPIILLPFIYCALKYERIYSEIINKGQGSAQPNISGNDIENIQIAFSESTISLFNEKLKSLFSIIITNQQESTRLASLRDTLLPKLMSGEVDVNDVKI